MRSTITKSQAGMIYLTSYCMLTLPDTLLSKSLYPQRFLLTKILVPYCRRSFLTNAMQNQCCNWSCNAPPHHSLTKRRKLVPPKRQRHSSYFRGIAAGHHVALSPERPAVEHAASTP